MKRISTVSIIIIIFTQLLIGSRPPYIIECWDLNNNYWGRDDVAYGIDNNNGKTVIVGSTAYGHRCFAFRPNSWTEIKHYGWPYNRGQEYQSVIISDTLALAVGGYYTDQILATFDIDNGYLYNTYVYSEGALFDIEKYNSDHYLVCGKNSYANGSNACIMELNSTFDTIIWDTVVYSFENSAKFYDLEVTDDGGFIVTGINGDSSLVKFDSSYNIEWAKSYGGVSICQNSASGYAICTGANSVSMILFDEDGDTISCHVYDTTGSANSIIYDPYSNGYLISGSTEIEARDGEDLKVIKVDDEGNLIWSFQYDGTSSSSTNYRMYDICYASILAESQEYEGPFDYLITGTIGMNWNDTLDSKDIFLLQFYNPPGGDEEYLNLCGITMEGVNTLNYPIIKNIINRNNAMVFNIENPGQMNINVNIYNILGQEIINLGTYSNDCISLNWDKNDNNGIQIAPGKYFITIETSNSLFTQDFLIVK